MSGRRARPVFNDRALESPRAGYVALGASGAGIICALVAALLGGIAGAPAWMFVIIALAFGVCAAIAAASLYEVRHATEQRASMARVTAQFERIIGQEYRP